MVIAHAITTPSIFISSFVVADPLSPPPAFHTHAIFVESISSYTLS